MDIDQEANLMSIQQKDLARELRERLRLNHEEYFHKFNSCPF